VTERLLLLALALAPISVFAQTRIDESPSTTKSEEPGDTQDGVNDKKDQPGQAPQPRGRTCASGDANAVDLLHLQWRAKNCVLLYGGFSNIPGSFIGLSYFARNFLHLGETLSLSSEYGVRRRSVELGFNKPSLFGTPIQTGFTVYGQRFQFNQTRESSVFAFKRDIPEFNQLPPDDRLNYVSYSYGGTVFAQYPLHGSSSNVRLTYSYDISNFKTLTDSTNYDFSSLNFQGVFGPSVLNGIRTGKLTPAFTHNTLDDPIRPTHGTALYISTVIAGLGGNVNTVEPTVEAKYFRSGFRKNHVIGMRLFGRIIAGYGGKAVPPFDRYYVGGEQDIRGFDSWSISPILYVPSATAVNLFNSDGSPRLQRIVVGGVETLVNVTKTVPIYRIVSSGGDTNVVINIEYRIPIGGPFTVTFFTDAGVNRLTFRNQLQVSQGLIRTLSQEFPGTAFNAQPLVQPGTQRIRMSNGIEFQVLLPKIKAPLRFYGAYNSLAYRDIVQAPLAGEDYRAYFPNQATYLNALNVVNAPIPFRERRFMFRFSIGRTFGGRP
jgi:outer membrane protein insertion porin family